jgi:hypothetical protein
MLSITDEKLGLAIIFPIQLGLAEENLKRETIFLFSTTGIWYSWTRMLLSFFFFNSQVLRYLVVRNLLMIYFCYVDNEIL